MKLLLLGVTGQLGSTLSATCPHDAELVAPTRQALDMGDADALRRVVQEVRPDVVVNAAAYTAVDRAEQEQDEAMRVNATAVAQLAAACVDRGARLVHVSTDFVFDGSACRPLLPGDATVPQGAYGRSKLAGERSIRATPGLDWVIVRTAWLYAAHGSNFVNTMLRLMRERETVRVVSDQVGTPTAAHSLAAATWRIVQRREVTGVHHWTDAGVASWYDFAVAISEEALALGLLERPVHVLPIRSEEFPTAAQRPTWSVLDKSATWRALDLQPPHWRENLRQVLREIRDA